jgi:hypothetical protein
VLYARDVLGAAGFYASLGFEEHARLTGPTAQSASSGCAATAPSSR